MIFISIEFKQQPKQFDKWRKVGLLELKILPLNLYSKDWVYQKI